eukprot:1463481-Amphidinium_carterae.1
MGMTSNILTATKSEIPIPGPTFRTLFGRGRSRQLVWQSLGFANGLVYCGQSYFAEKESKTNAYNTFVHTACFNNHVQLVRTTAPTASLEITFLQHRIV